MLEQHQSFSICVSNTRSLLRLYFFSIPVYSKSVHLIWAANKNTTLTFCVPLLTILLRYMHVFVPKIWSMFMCAFFALNNLYGVSPSTLLGPIRLSTQTAVSTASAHSYLVKFFDRNIIHAIYTTVLFVRSPQPFYSDSWPPSRLKPFTDRQRVTFRRYCQHLPISVLENKPCVMLKNCKQSTQSTSISQTSDRKDQSELFHRDLLHAVDVSKSCFNVAFHLHMIHKIPHHSQQ